MKQCNKTIALAAVLAFLTLAAASLQAQTTNVLTITATASVQGSSSDNNGVTTYAAPSKMTLDTKQILALLAIAENSESNYPSATFPAGAKLVVLSDSSNDFMVLDKNNNFLVNVSDILSATSSGTYGSEVTSGKVNDTTGLASTTVTKQEIVTVAYDDTGAGGSLQFYLTGLMTSTTTDTVPNATTGNYKETESRTMTAGAGDGNSLGNPLVITGGFSGSGSGTLSQ
jgi:hypothetical protein